MDVENGSSMRLEVPNGWRLTAFDYRGEDIRAYPPRHTILSLRRNGDDEEVWLGTRPHPGDIVERGGINRPTVFHFYRTGPMSRQELEVEIPNALYGMSLALAVAAKYMDTHTMDVPLEELLAAVDASLTQAAIAHP